MLKSPELYSYILSGKVVLGGASDRGVGNINDFIKMTDKSKSYSEIKKNTKKVSKNALDFAYTSTKAIALISSIEDFKNSLSELKQINKNKHLNMKAKEYFSHIRTVARCIQKTYPGMGTAFLNLMTPLIKTDTGTHIPFSEWIRQKYGPNSAKNIWNIDYSEFYSVIAIDPNSQNVNPIWQNQNYLAIERRQLALSMANWFQIAYKFHTTSNGQFSQVANYLRNFNEFIVNTDNNKLNQYNLNRLIYTASPSLPEALNLDRLTRWFSIPFELLDKANKMFSIQANGQKFSDMKGLIHPKETATFDKKLKFNSPEDYREQFMNWHTAQKNTKGKDNYYIGDQLYVRSVLINWKSGKPLAKFDNTWNKANYKKAGLYYLTPKNSLRNRESVKSEFAYHDHPNNGKSWKTSEFERNGNQPITQRAKPDKNHLASRLAVDFEYDYFPIGHPENPFTNAFVIDFWGEYKGDPSKTNVGTYRTRISIEDYIAHINGIKDHNVLSHLKTHFEFYGGKKWGKVLDKNMDEQEFNRLIAQDPEFRKIVLRAMRNKKGC
ncbi:MAG: hypothetical protein ACTSYY_02655 [Promethearchaeota archaeon]